MNAKLITGVRPPNGTYKGLWGAYVIDFTYKGQLIELETEKGIRSFDIPVTVTISDESIIFDYEDED